MSRKWPVLGASRWFKLLPLMVMLGCDGGPAPADGDASSLTGTTSFLDDLFQGAKGTKPRPAPVLSRAATKLVKVSSQVQSLGSSLTPKKALHSGLLEAIKQEGKIPPDQLHSLLYDLVEPRSKACAGVSCGRVFGIRTQDINRELDDLLKDVQTSRTLADPKHRALKKDLVESLARPKIKSQTDALMGPGAKEGPAASATLEGTCAGGTLMAYGLRTLGSFQSVVGSLNPFKNTIDYRNNMPKKFQGVTGSCHLFATLELFRHHRDDGFQHTKNISIERTFAEIWAKALGESAEKAVENEIETFKIFQIGQRMTLRGYAGQGLSKGEAVQKALQQASFQIRFYPQGGSGLDDFAYIKEHGAVLDDGAMRPLPMKELEDLGEELALARVSLLRKSGMEGPESVSPDLIRSTMRPVMAKIFALANESRGVSGRMTVARELGKYEMVSKRFDARNMQASIKEFMAALENHGPLYVGTDRHATLLVAYNSWRNRFLIRDSADTLGRPYVELSGDQFFNRLRLYYYLTPKS